MHPNQQKQSRELFCLRAQREGGGNWPSLNLSSFSAMNSHATALRFIKLLAFFAMLIHHADGHGRLMEPPARNAMWRFGFPNPVNYNDNGKLLAGAASLRDSSIFNETFSPSHARPGQSFFAAAMRVSFKALALAFWCCDAVLVLFAQTPKN